MRVREEKKQGVTDVREFEDVLKGNDRPMAKMFITQMMQMEDFRFFARCMIWWHVELEKKGSRAESKGGDSDDEDAKGGGGKDEK